MTGRSSSKPTVPALFTSLGNIIGNHWRQIAGGTGGLGGIVAILNGVFGVQLVPYGTALVQYFTSDGAVTLLLLTLLISQILLYQRVDWVVDQLESRYREEVEEPPGESQSDSNDVDAMTDGGSSNLPPRDNDGQFTTKGSGGSNIFLLILSAITGYIFGAETGVIDPLAAALIAVALIAFLQAEQG